MHTISPNLDAQATSVNGAPTVPGRVLAAMHDDQGAAAVSFILAFPIFLVLVGIVVQFALIANARIVVQHAAYAAARSASTSLPDGHPEKVRRAAQMALAPISPVAGNVDAEGRDISQALQDCQVQVSNAYAARYAYAMEAASVEWTDADADYETDPGREIDITVRYRFQLTVPVAGALLSPTQGHVAGTEGRFYEVTATARARTSPGRKVRADSAGLPIQRGSSQ